MFSPFWDFYAMNRLSPTACGRGYAGVAAFGDVSSTLLNPASCKTNGRFESVLAYCYKSELPWLRDLWDEIGETHLKTIHPCILAGISGHLGPLNAGVLYYNRSSYRLDLGLNYNTGPNGEDLGRVMAYEDVRVSVISIPVTYRFANVVSVGLSADIGYYARYLHSLSDFRQSFMHVIPRFGYIVGPIRGMSFGTSFEPRSTSTYEAVLFPDYTREDYSINVMYANTYPAKYDMGISYRAPNIPLTALLDINHVWTRSCARGLRNRHDVKIGVEYTVRNIVARVGFFTLYDYRIGPVFSLDPYAGSAHQYFLTAGATIPGRVPVTVGIMDSHLLSRGEWKTTMVTVCLNYQR